MQPIVTILVVAVVVESLTEYFVAPAIPEKYKMYLPYAAALIAVFLCVAYRVDLLAAAGLVSPIPAVGWIVSGFLIGRGSNFVNDFADRWLK
ncbi:MAG: hypothetical protein ACUVWZ_13840 [Anaerolineae bacterium]